MRQWQVLGSHLRQMQALALLSSIRVSVILSQMANQEASMLPSRLMISPKIWRSADGDLSEKQSYPGCSCWVLRQSWTRVQRALSWKVKAQRLGSVQKSSRMLLPAVLVHSLTGSGMTGTLRRERRVDFPAPMLPQIEMTPGILNQMCPLLLYSGFVEGDSQARPLYPTYICNSNKIYYSWRLLPPHHSQAGFSGNEQECQLY